MFLINLHRDIIIGDKFHNKIVGISEKNLIDMESLKIGEKTCLYFKTCLIVILESVSNISNTYIFYYSSI